jgi:hypothetical protein
MARTPTWVNNDGLAIYLGDDESVLGNGGEYRTDGLFRVIDVEIDLASLTEAEVVQSRVVFPKGKVLGKVEVIADAAATLGTAIDVGFVRTNAAANEVDYDGILAAFPIASMNAEGEVTVLTDGSSGAGVLVGVVASADYPMYITASRTDSTAFGAGRIRLRLHWYKKTPTT